MKATPSHLFQAAPTQHDVKQTQMARSEMPTHHSQSYQNHPQAELSGTTAGENTGLMSRYELDSSNTSYPRHSKG